MHGLSHSTDKPVAKGAGRQNISWFEENAVDEERSILGPPKVAPPVAASS